MEWQVVEIKIGQLFYFGIAHDIKKFYISSIGIDTVWEPIVDVPIQYANVKPTPPIWYDFEYFTAH